MGQKRIRTSRVWPKGEGRPYDLSARLAGGTETNRRRKFPSPSAVQWAKEAESVPPNWRQISHRPTSLWCARGGAPDLKKNKICRALTGPSGPTFFFGVALAVAFLGDALALAAAMPMLCLLVVTILSVASRCQWRPSHSNAHPKLFFLKLTVFRERRSFSQAISEKG